LFGYVCGVLFTFFAPSHGVSSVDEDDDDSDDDFSVAKLNNIVI
jgi:hypothetical protein